MRWLQACRRPSQHVYRRACRRCRRRLPQGEQLQQRAERKRGAQAAGLYAEAVVRVQDAVDAIAAARKLTNNSVRPCRRPPMCPLPPQSAALHLPAPQAKYKEALALAGRGGAAPPAAEHAAALFGCAESLQGGAEATVAAGSGGARRRRCGCGAAGGCAGGSAAAGVCGDVSASYGGRAAACRCPCLLRQHAEVRLLGGMEQAVGCLAGGSRVAGSSC